MPSLFFHRIDRGERVDHAGADIALVARNRARRFDQTAAHLVGRELRIARQQQRGDTAGMGGGERGPALPTAAISTMPRACALASMSRNIGSGGPAKLILTMRAFLLAAQSRPLRMLKVVPCAPSAVPEKARTASSFTFGATPTSFECAAMAPAMPVPCICAGPGVPSASYSSAITPARSE